ncbi:MAG TPA: galactoside ABC transporter permease, partial [Sphaerochaeta sp.]|nr:galactoside ABC transporter permease [Sphaerochaeta sp.]
MNADYQEIMELTEDPKIIEYSQTLNKLRENGVNKIKKLRQDIVALRKSKMVHPQEKRKQI